MTSAYLARPPRPLAGALRDTLLAVEQQLAALRHQPVWRRAAYAERLAALLRRAAILESELHRRQDPPAAGERPPPGAAGETPGIDDHHAHFAAAAQ